MAQYGANRHLVSYSVPYSWWWRHIFGLHAGSLGRCHLGGTHGFLEMERHARLQAGNPDIVDRGTVHGSGDGITAPAKPDTVIFGIVRGDGYATRLRVGSPDVVVLDAAWTDVSSAPFVAKMASGCTPPAAMTLLSTTSLVVDMAPSRCTLTALTLSSSTLLVA
jgi:hypothetical protein